MKQKGNSITANLKHTALVLVFFAMVAQLSHKIIVSITDFNSEIFSVNPEQDIDTEEAQENDNENDKIEIQKVPILKDIYHLEHYYSITGTHHLCTTSIVFSEISIPPPEFV